MGLGHAQADQSAEHGVDARAFRMTAPQEGHILSPLRRSYVPMFVDEVIVGAAPNELSDPHIIVRGSQSTIKTAVISSAVSKKGQVPVIDL